jgi:hypothetical protein
MLSREMGDGCLGLKRWVAKMLRKAVVVTKGLQNLRNWATNEMEQQHLLLNSLKNELNYKIRPYCSLPQNVKMLKKSKERKFELLSSKNKLRS